MIKLIKGVNDLATARPDLVAEWDYEKNSDLKPEDVTVGSGRKAWWKCPAGHSYEQLIYNHTNGHRKCPICSGKQVLKGFNDLQTKFPDIAEGWDYEKNGDLKPEDVMAHSNRHAWWKCPIGHSYQSKINNRTSNHRGCPYCAKEGQTSFSEQALFFYIKKYYSDAINSDRDAIGMELDIYIPTLKIAIEYDGVYFHKNSNTELKKNKLCNDNDILLIRIREEGLSLYDDCYCIVRPNDKSYDSLSDVIKQVLLTISKSSDVDVNVDRDQMLIQSTYIISRKKQNLQNIYPEIAKEWHPTKNGNLTPEMITVSNHKKFWWKCSKGHEWQATVGSRTGKEKCGCPYCSGRYVIKGFNDLQTKFPDIAKEWDYEKNDSLTPSDVTSGAEKIVWWKCPVGHSYEQLIYNRTGKQRFGCPYCSGHKVLQGFNDLKTNFPNIAKEWDYEKNNGLTPVEVTPGSNKKVWWKCSLGHSYIQMINSRTGKLNGCPKCGKRKVAEAKFKQVICMETGIIYPSIKAAEAEMKIDHSNISACCKGKYKQTHGYHFKYVEE